MKKSITKLIVLIFIFLGFINAQSIQTLKFNSAKYQRAEANLLEGLKSDNFGLKSSCVYYLGEMMSDKAVVPLMSIMRGAEDERLQIMAALSLAKIGDNRGIFLIKRNAEFSDNERLKRLFEQFYIGHTLKLRKGTTEVEYRHIALSNF